MIHKYIQTDARPSNSTKCKEQLKDNRPTNKIGLGAILNNVNPN